LDDVRIIALGTFQVANATPADGSVTTAKLAAAAVTQAKLGANVAGNGPAFSASYAGGAFTHGVNAVVALNAEQFDTSNCFNNTGATVNGIPAYSFKPNVAGYYLVTFGVQYQGAAYAGYFVGQINKSGSGYRESVLRATDTYVWTYGSAVVYFDGASDYINLSAVQLQGTTQSMAGNMSAALVRAA
jgi:hypothetical protein